MPHVSEVEGLVAHGGEDATTEGSVVGRMRDPERLGHVPLRELMPASVGGHPADAERELGGGAEQRPADRVAESAAEKGGHLPPKVRHRKGKCCPAASGVVDRLEVVPHRPDPVDLRKANPPRAGVPLDSLVKRSDEPSQRDVAGYCHGTQGTKELAAVQVVLPQLDERADRTVEIISPSQAVIGLERPRGEMDAATRAGPLQRLSGGHREGRRQAALAVVLEVAAQETKPLPGSGEPS